MRYLFKPTTMCAGFGGGGGMSEARMMLTLRVVETQSRGLQRVVHVRDIRNEIGSLVPVKVWSVQSALQLQLSHLDV